MTTIRQQEVQIGAGQNKFLQYGARYDGVS